MSKQILALPVSRWSTDQVAPRDRCASVIDALGKAIVPIRMEISNPAVFAFHMSSIVLDDGFVLLHQTGTPHRTYRQRGELARSEAHTYHFMINLRSELQVDHCGKKLIRAGEGVLIDSSRALELRLPRQFEVIHVKMSEAWLRRWLVPDKSLIGQRISATEGMDRALTAFVAQLTPHSLLTAALDPAALAAQVGSLLLMCSSEHSGKEKCGLVRGPEAGDQILACMTLHCSNPALTKEEVGRELGMTEGQVDEVLARHGHTFAGALAAMRNSALDRMLRTPTFQELPLIELYARAGFSHVRRFLDGPEENPGPAAG
jgi:hypothetical protein